MASHRIRDIRYLAAHYALNGNGLDGTGRYDAGLFNTPTWGTFLTGRGCIEFDGNNQYGNCGDILELNTVSAFSICFWMAQNVLDVDDTIFRKALDVDYNVGIKTRAANGHLYIELGVGTQESGHFDYSAAISAANWHHVAAVFDGSQTGDANRLVVYVDGTPIVLLFDGMIPAVTADLSGQDATIGAAANTFDGSLYDFRIHSCALSRDEIIEIIHQAVPV